MLSKMEYMSICQYTAKEWEGISGLVGIWEVALFKKISLSERSEFEIFLNAFSSFPNALELHGSETKPEIPSHSFASLLKKLMGKNKK